MTSSAELVTLAVLEDAYRVVQASPFCVRTPLIKSVQTMFDFIDPSIDLYLKLENMQNTGSFKARGLANQLRHMPAECLSGERRMVTYSAGNYGKAFAMGTSQLGLKGLVIMPDMSPVNRSKLIQSFGAEVERIPNSAVEARLDECRKEGMYVAHPFDDPTIIAGYGSIAFEILEDLPDPDLVITCCGGGGMLAGMAAGFKLMPNNQTTVYGAEPEQASTMYRSLREGHAVTDNKATSIAAGLAPPSAGENTYAHCREFVDDVALVSDEDIVRNMLRLYRRGLVVEPSGAAAFAAIAEKKVANITGKKVVVIISGGNVAIDELHSYAERFPHLVQK